MIDLWLVIPTGARTQYLQDIFKECDVEPSKRVLVRTLPDDDVPDNGSIVFMTTAPELLITLILISQGQDPVAVLQTRIV